MVQFINSKHLQRTETNVASSAVLKTPVSYNHLSEYHQEYIMWRESVELCYGLGKMSLFVFGYLRIPTCIYVILNCVNRHESTSLCRGGQSLVAARTKEKTEAMAETPLRCTVVQRDVDIAPEIISEFPDGIT